MHVKLGLIICSWVYMCTAFAGIGMTKQAVDRMYGKSTKTIRDDTPFYVYNKGRFQILIHFHRNSADHIVYRKKSATNTTKRLPMSAREIRTFKAKNNLGYRWRSYLSREPAQWVTDNPDKNVDAGKKVRGYYHADTRELIFYTLEYEFRMRLLRVILSKDKHTESESAGKTEYLKK